MAEGLLNPSYHLRLYQHTLSLFWSGIDVTWPRSRLRSRVRRQEYHFEPWMWGAKDEQAVKPSDVVQANARRHKAKDIR